MKKRSIKKGRREGRTDGQRRLRKKGRQTGRQKVLKKMGIENNILISDRRSVYCSPVLRKEEKSESFLFLNLITSS